MRDLKWKGGRHIQEVFKGEGKLSMGTLERGRRHMVGSDSAYSIQKAKGYVLLTCAYYIYRVHAHIYTHCNHACVLYMPYILVSMYCAEITLYTMYYLLDTILQQLDHMSSHDLGPWQ